mmetsp:Transcript_28093/g.61329  ORF Transcript_28093/g.61329 Transcript_28093/m.61329 type:complete len:266 (-) Transcript_28093:349-1146(-)|eukprot:CAMPEP_0170577116 /NCGR_PEP_ID=MMETSP0224-20130122/4752_1 /TAXON_ID=285029 /ORGANISM="Togula jolla, Strain CCCM 725" /LENGTH=265 /DNA_ID=CAMNT_0010899999 /DNA_START=1 /DNA_END=798 /DNA_ORIENTATION=+
MKATDSRVSQVSTCGTACSLNSESSSTGLQLASPDISHSFFFHGDLDWDVKLVVIGTAAKKLSHKVSLASPVGKSYSIEFAEFSSSSAKNISDYMTVVPSFQLKFYLDKLPVCTSRQQALSTTLVYVLQVDPAEDENSVHKQLSRYGHILNELRGSSSRLRPSRALLLVHADRGATDSHAEEIWQSALRDFELVHNGIVKFGPVSTEDAKGILQVFECMAFSMKMRRQDSGGSDSEGSNFSSAAPLYEAEREEDYLKTDASHISI